MKPSKRHIAPYITIVTAMIIWSGAGIAVKASLEVLSPLQLVLVRFTIAVLLMLIIGTIGQSFSKGSLTTFSLQRIDKHDWWLFALAGLFQPFLYFILETYSYRSFATPTMAEPFLSTSPLMAPLFAFWILKEKVTVNNIIGILISTVGMVMLVLIGNQNFDIGNPWGIPLALLTTMMAVGYSIVLKRIPSHYSALTIVFWVQLVALVMFYVLWLITGPSLPAIDWGNASCQRMMLGVGYLAIFASVCAFIFFCYSVRYIGVTQANVFNNIRPVFTALLMWLFMGEHLPLGKWAGIVLVIVGLFISQRQKTIK